MPKVWLVGLSVLALVTGCASTTNKNTLPLTACKLTAPGSTQRITAQCGTWTVFEDRVRQTGRKLTLHFAVIPALGKTPEPDPIVFLPGGPGQAATEAYLGIAPVFDRLNQKRDILLVDQRGTGQSHPLRCPQPPSTYTEKQVIAFAQQCPQKLDADLRLYTTPLAMADLDEIRAQLGYTKLNLYGGSYGTRSALQYMRQYPDQVRTVILDGVDPPNWNLGEDIAQDAERALQLILQRCAQNTRCHQQFPQLQQEFQALLKQLDQKPVSLTVIDPQSGERKPFTLNRANFVSTVRLFSYFPEILSLLPLTIHRAHTTQDFSVLAAQASLVVGQFNESISDGLFNAVVCTEDVPFYTQKTPQTGYFGGFAQAGIRESCRSWPKGALPANFKQPVQSAIPTLILSGEADPVTPPRNGTLAARTLTQSLHIVAPGQAHIVATRGCIPRILTQFIEKGTTTSLDTQCVAKLKAVPFFLNLSGPSP